MVVEIFIVHMMCLKSVSIADINEKQVILVAKVLDVINKPNFYHYSHKYTGGFTFDKENFFITNASTRFATFGILGFFEFTVLSGKFGLNLHGSKRVMQALTVLGRFHCE
ncbi:hypothetical protein [Aliivibrio sifiae]|uniref:Uncharacterized protein n=2 Tax=Aliivibrio sifiae TaxID=566293 RepID=A0ABQ6ANV1_9GAMM|nr:hypothetical protein [Aliivibrio sifiae]GLR77250.1 hypothetical protein GCM10007855_41250 [Aliivibrio sifiae]